MELITIAAYDIEIPGREVAPVVMELNSLRTREVLDILQDEGLDLNYPPSLLDSAVGARIQRLEQWPSHKDLPFRMVFSLPDEYWDYRVATQFNLPTLAEILKKEMAEGGGEDCDDNPDVRVTSHYLGTVMGQTPSGKFYAPFANSNVAKCPACKGKGELPNRDADEKKYNVLHACQLAMRRGMMTEYGPACDGKWDKALAKKLDELTKLRDRFQSTLTCPGCGGLGSLEAHHDECWREAMDRVCQSLDLSFESGEGDPCDLYVCYYQEKEEDDDDDS